jgi:hypothetical protein|tara:strand:+ start:101 stop:541 length:441 start_codon:yes stop_codon:yes gene_type:complete
MVCNGSCILFFNELNLVYILGETIMTTQTFSVVGITEHNGQSKVRFTEDMVRRVKQFSKGGATRVEFITLPEAMTKLDGLEFMLTHDMFSSPEDQAIISDAIADRSMKAYSKTYKVSMSLDAIRERGKQQQADADTLESVLNAVVS